MVVIAALVLVYGASVAVTVSVSPAVVDEVNVTDAKPATVVLVGEPNVAPEAPLLCDHVIVRTAETLLLY